MSKESYLVFKFKGKEIGAINFKEYLSVPQNRTKTIKGLINELNQHGFSVRIKFKEKSA